MTVSNTGSRRLRRLAALAAAGMVLAAAATAGLLAVTLRGSLPLLDGAHPLPGLSSPVEVTRDALGIPTIRGTSRLDVARATGFVQAQDRFFQMDLLRRAAAGELAALVGPAAVGADRAVRIHRFRSRARAVIENRPADSRALLEAYAEGVNAGLRALGTRPFEYLLLRAEPEPWTVEDSVLVVYAMFLQLHDSRGGYESTLGILHERMPAALAEFLAPIGNSWDAPIEGAPWPAVPIPGPDVFDLRGGSPVAVNPDPAESRLAPGSNNWAIDGSRAAGGRPIVANDMHLDIQVPNTWYRSSLAFPDPRDGAPRTVTGVSLPGTPAITQGSNGRVAWGFTNAYVDTVDVVLVEIDPQDSERYRIRGGSKAFDRRRETIVVRGSAPVEIEVVETVWGPLVAPDRAIRWTAHDLEASGMDFGPIELARSLDEAFDAAPAVGIPPQNLVLADDAGHIGWTICGRLPRRVGFDGRLPASWADGSRRWEGWLDATEMPRVVDPPAGRVWTANARVVSGDALARLGDGGYDLGARAGQIRDGLAALSSATPADMLRVQLDDRALFMTRWRDLLLAALTPEACAARPGRGEMRRLVESWGARASADSAGYRLVRAFRSRCHEQVLGALLDSCVKADPAFAIRELTQAEDAVFRLATERPSHLLNPKYRSWDEQLLAVADLVLDELEKGGRPLAERTWGERNTTKIRHPLSAALPILSRWLDMPAEPLPGDWHMPRVQGASFGASERMAVSPGREAEGYYHMPCGQSGHPLSPYYSAGHEAWARGEATPFLPGKAEHTLRLEP